MGGIRPALPTTTTTSSVTNEPKTEVYKERGAKHSRSTASLATKPGPQQIPLALLVQPNVEREEPQLHQSTNILGPPVFPRGK